MTHRPPENDLRLMELTDQIHGHLADAPDSFKSLLCAHIGAIRALTYGADSERLLQSLARATSEIEGMLFVPPEDGELFHKAAGDVDTPGDGS